MNNQKHSSSEAPFKIQSATSQNDLVAVKDLFRTYEKSLGIDLCFQGFEEELDTLPGKYGPPEGELLLATTLDGRPIGCVALRPIDRDTCEMKRLYVDPEARGMGLGRALVERILDAGRELGYREMRLDTLPTMASAVAIYERHGFEPMEAYYSTPIQGTLFMKCSLL